MFDSFDLKLLNAMQEDADRTAEQLAEIVALSPSAIARRLRRLREAGAIAHTVAILPGSIVGVIVGYATAKYGGPVRSSTA